ncbi:hypothetical protein CYMTET_23270 [Cymbomonas tetramitiformis]|uniref:RING-type domain-containing protein n=1 Tax=Cymbomonas tetramitiformis TaxID=36881 RepID=A0AAE0FZR9_9CHLO|nr:hypothetical protein CYMTET_23270 [Cymbomonas tetramitiformis]
MQSPVDEELCAICQSAIRKSATLACSHVFCLECILTWSSKKHKCPLCKQKFDFVHVDDEQVEIPEAAGLGLPDEIPDPEFEVVPLTTPRRIMWRVQHMARVISQLESGAAQLTSVAFPDDFESWLFEHYGVDEIFETERDPCWHRRDMELMGDLLKALCDFRENHVKKLKLRGSSMSTNELSAEVVTLLARTVRGATRLRVLKFVDVRISPEGWESICVSLRDSSVRTLKLVDMDFGYEVGGSSERVRGMFVNDARAFEAFTKMCEGLIASSITNFELKNCSLKSEHMCQISALMQVNKNIKLTVCS